MRKFDYSKFENCLWDNEILRYLTPINEHKGRQELFSRQKPVELEKRDPTTISGLGFYNRFDLLQRISRT